MEINMVYFGLTYNGKEFEMNSYSGSAHNMIAEFEQACMNTYGIEWGFLFTEIDGKWIAYYHPKGGLSVMSGKY